MSLLLDALNKADQERKRYESAPSINSNHETLVEDGYVITPMVLIGCLMALVLIIGSAVYFFHTTSAQTIGNSSPANNINHTSNAVQHTAPNTAPNTLQTSNEIKKNPTINSTEMVAQEAPVLDGDNTSTEIPPEQASHVANLYQKNTTAVPTQETTSSLAPSKIETPTVAVVQNAPTSITQYTNLPELHDLPTPILNRIPSLTYTEHNYNANGGSVKINGDIKHNNEVLGGGVVIDRILEDGLILHIDTYSFKMRALNSWVNM